MKLKPVWNIKNIAKTSACVLASCVPVSAIVWALELSDIAAFLLSLPIGPFVMMVCMAKWPMWTWELRESMKK